MNRIFITGDVHGDIDIHKFKRFKKSTENIDRSDILIICGDMGCLWDNGRFDKYIKRYWEQQPWTVLWIDGNHENFDLLYQYPVIIKWGGKVQQTADNVYHLCRGEVFTICDKTFFAFGGAQSHDRITRKEGISWWAREMPTEDEYNNGFNSLSKFDNKVDFIITHSVADSDLSMFLYEYEHNKLTNYFEALKSIVDYKEWFSGHYHKDILLPGEVRLLYNDILEL